MKLSSIRIPFLQWHDCSMTVDKRYPLAAAQDGNKQVNGL